MGVARLSVHSLAGEQPREDWPLGTVETLRIYTHALALRTGSTEEPGGRGAERLAQHLELHWPLNFGAILGAWDD
jgi:hypothetical protein